MYSIVYSGKFKKDVKLLQKRGYDLEILKKVILTLEKKGELEIHFQPHKLSGKLSGYWEAHLKPDWLLIWKKVNTEIWLARTGTHSDLF